MAERRRQRRATTAALPLLGPAVAALLLAPGARAAWQVSPTVELRESWSDNVSLRRDGQKDSQFITSITPGIAVTNRTPRLQVSAAYRLNIHEYSDGRVAGTDRLTSALSATAKGKLIDDLLFFDAQAGISQQPVSAFGPVASGSEYSSTNRSEVRTYQVSPYLVHRFGSTASAELRYAHDMVDSENSGYGRSTSDTASLNLSSGRAFRTVGWGLTLRRQHLQDSIAPGSNSSMALASLRYIVTPTFSLTGTGGYDKFDYAGMGGGTQGASWSGGFSWNPSTRTSLQMSAGKRYYGNSYFLAATHRSRHTVWNIGYSDNVTTSRENFLLPSAVNTADMLNALFRTSYPDAAIRALAVEAYIRAFNLPRSLPDSVNYFSNRYILQRQLNASMAWRSARTTALVTLFRTKREALSLLQYDSSLLGSSQQNLNDNTSQTGGALMVDYRLNGRTSASLSATVTKTESDKLGLGETNRQLRAAVSRTFQPNLSGSMEVRRNHGGLALEGSSYTENAVAASLSMKF
ncbi:TIGR03016 family PEP-CTERM system-associated outer membrane protein [Pseudoduganella chitinolytica]|uniref:TIGR03016 family PEP-CTERM system-associated outer membrane protein n=1 Tax=Pseudoduganella chitinolytica TaxID=34070 RepID=A0ABY8B772_9BURK|nr:TIGR03016 family PEP-CTERM system-associated outer membrane protein [Pseudoduganella chitinolytica]WEF31784.1 TIGR03016 family PEP-CTERM system-associated outer membrane protein [Pseudoduganella chitinolytica]